MKKQIFTAILFITGLTLFSCGKKNNIDTPNVQSTVEVTKKNHTWYYFTNGSYKHADKIQNVPFQTPVPWTEAVRISSANSLSDDGNGSAKAYAIVNRLGILTFEYDKITISSDKSLFNDRTAGNLVFLNNTPVFSVYKSAFFNNTITEPDYQNSDDKHLFLLQFDDTAKISYPVINSTNITKEPNSEVTDFVWDGINFICSVKSITDTKNSFSYIYFKPSVPLLSLSPSTAKDNLVIQEKDADYFRNARQQIDYQKAPERIKNLVANFADTTSFSIDVKSAGGTSSRTYQNKIPESQQKELQAKAIIDQSWSAALFEDGTIFIEGALPGKHILRNGRPVVIRLPKLPTGFVYSDFIISGTTLFAAWEETSFYKTGRSGFLEVNLDKTLYSKIL